MKKNSWSHISNCLLEPYTKPALTIEQQADRLIERGLVVSNRSELEQFLSNVSYYRLTAYLFPFKENGEEHFKDGTTFEIICRRYNFDRRFRILVLDAIERVETALKSRIVNSFVIQYSAFGYLDVRNFNNFPQDKYDRFLNEIRDSVDRSRERFVEHFRNKYSNSDLPLWMVSELISFGTMFTMFRNMNYVEKKAIANSFKLSLAVFESWLLTLNYIRNICAHHARLWNKRLGVQPKRPVGKGFEAWTAFDTEKPFFVLFILSYLLHFCAPRTLWRNRVEDLLQEYNELPLHGVGFVKNWNKHPIWNN